MPVVLNRMKNRNTIFSQNIDLLTIKYTFDVSKLFTTHSYIDRHLAVNEKPRVHLKTRFFFILIAYFEQ